jgi:hypothetical protein
MMRTTAGTSSARKQYFATLVVSFLCCFGLNVEAKIKCWTNNDGVRECGNSVPAEYAQKGHHEMSEGGVKRRETGRAKSLEGLELERAAEREKAAAVEIEREQAAKDRVLLDTFSSEDDFVLALDGQVAHLESQIKITENHNTRLKLSLEELIQDAANHERRGKEPPEKLVTLIKSLREQMRDNKAFIGTNHLEQIALQAKFDTDIARFRKLKGNQE